MLVVACSTARIGRAGSCHPAEWVSTISAGATALYQGSWPADVSTLRTSVITAFARVSHQGAALCTGGTVAAPYLWSC